jgi:hypothetical protein
MPVEDDMGIFLDVLLVRLLWLWCRYGELFSFGLSMDYTVRGLPCVYICVSTGWYVRRIRVWRLDKFVV